MVYSKCPKCGKKGLHHVRQDPLNNALLPNHKFECRYCHYHEGDKEQVARLR